MLTSKTIMPLIDPVTMASNNPPAKSALPIELLPKDIARIASQAHPALLLAAYYMRFSSFVADPVSTLLSSLVPLAIVQAGYALLCLPPAGTNSKPAKKPKPGASKKGLETPTTGPAVSSSKTYLPFCKITHND
jgi:phosphatidylinositol glycan class F